MGALLKGTSVVVRKHRSHFPPTSCTGVRMIIRLLFKQLVNAVKTLSCTVLFPFIPSIVCFWWHRLWLHSGKDSRNSHLLFIADKKMSLRENVHKRQSDQTFAVKAVIWGKFWSLVTFFNETVCKVKLANWYILDKTILSTVHV